MAEQSSPPHFDVEVAVTKGNLIKEEFFKILKHLKPSWNPTDLECQELSGGYVNLMVRCHLKDSPDDSIVFRIWPAKKAEESCLNRKMELGLINKLDGKGVAPTLYASFTNGLCYEFFDGEKLTPSACRIDEIAKSVAKNFAIIHSTKVDGFDFEPTPMKFINYGYEGYPYEHPNEEKNKILKASTPTREEAKQEIDFLENYIKELQSVTVQCHGDPQVQNNMYNKETGRVITVDYEVAYIGYQPADIAYFFLFIIFDYNDFQTSFRDMGFPEESFQRKFLRWYLEQWFEETGKNAKDVTEKDVERLFIQVNKYLLVMYFHFAVIFLKLAGDQAKAGFHDDIKAVNFYELGMTNFRKYFEKKDPLRSLKLPE